MRNGVKLLIGSVVAVILALTLQASSYADEGKGKGSGKVVELDEDGEVEVIEEDELGRPELVKITHIFRNGKGKGRGRQQAIACSCPGPDGSNFKVLKYKWFDPSFGYTVYTLNSGLGAGAGTAVIDSFRAWTNAEPVAPAANATQNDISAGPGIGFDSEQNVSWQPLSATYGANTLAVTVTWFTRVKINGFAKVVHFDMAYNTDHPWSIAGSTENCGGGVAFDVQNVGTHEAGHVYGLGHHTDCNLTMNPTAGLGETIKSSLATGDINGIKSLY